MSERSASIAATSSSSVPTRGATDGGSEGCGTDDSGAAPPAAGRAHSGADQEAWGATGSGATGVGSGADGAFHEAAHDGPAGCSATGATGATCAGCAQADERTGSTGCCWSGAGASTATSSLLR